MWQIKTKHNKNIKNTKKHRFFLTPKPSTPIFRWLNSLPQDRRRSGQWPSLDPPGLYRRGPVRLLQPRSPRPPAQGPGSTVNGNSIEISQKHNKPTDSSNTIRFVFFVFVFFGFFYVFGIFGICWLFSMF